MKGDDDHMHDDESVKIVKQPLCVRSVTNRIVEQSLLERRDEQSLLVNMKQHSMSVRRKTEEMVEQSVPVQMETPPPLAPFAVTPVRKIKARVAKAKLGCSSACCEKGNNEY